MRILFLTRSFNSLTQRLYLDLTAAGHDVAIEFDIADAVTREALERWRPSLVVATFLKRAIPEAVWRALPCLVVHPGVVGDRGPSALDRAVADGEPTWGVTVLQATAEMDAGPVWASETFTMREATKSSLYRHEVTEAASRAVLAAVAHFERCGAVAPPAPPPDPRGRWRPLMTQAERRIDWRRDDTRTVLRKIRAADGVPGVLDELFGAPCHLYDAHAEPGVRDAAPGEVLARRGDALLRATVDGAVWIGHVRRTDTETDFKLPAALAFARESATLPERPLALDAPADAGWREIRYEARGRHVGVLHFPFYNGAMSTAQCRRLLEALRFALAQPTRVLVLAGGPDFWSNGIHLHVIEAADSPADESWRNIHAIDDVAQALIETTDRLVVAALQGNAGAGGAFLALAASWVWARPGVVLNPHYKNMGNLYGSEYWTYLLPRRLKCGTPADVMGRRLPLSAAQARQLGLVDDVFGNRPDDFLATVVERAAALAVSPEWPALVEARRRQRADDEAARPLAAYRTDELERMRRNFYGFDTSYHVARSNFVRRVAPSWTPRHLAIHR
ncbi:hydrogenase maturation protein [Azohydromonas sediminis]|uniref:hydrogenase maturation protein n=1 Tax=Azohydromonas sediminis TaxID=2259674 RepID=UPI000E65C4FC|nr:hydrogenase maturation protein [Azohydromonas sediminis]